MVLWLILSVLLQFATAFLLRFCYDEVKLWLDDDNVPSLHQPELLDLCGTNDTYTMQKYVENVVCPANVYFMTCGQIRKRIEDKEGGEFIHQLILHAFTCILIAFVLLKMNFLLVKWLCLVIAIAISCLGTWLASFIYKRTHLPLRSFEYSLSELRGKFEKQKEYQKFNISEKDAFNNYIIGVHAHYIYSIENKIVFRDCVRKVVVCVSTLTYILFFWTIPK